MTFPEPTTDGHWRPACSLHRTRNVTELCPPCRDVQRQAEQGKAS